MPKDYIERFIEEDDKVKYIRTMPMPPNKTVDVEIYLTKNYLTDMDEEHLESYLSHAVAGVLTRNGVSDAS